MTDRKKLIADISAYIDVHYIPLQEGFRNSYSAELFGMNDAGAFTAPQSNYKDAFIIADEDGEDLSARKTFMGTLRAKKVKNEIVIPKQSGGGKYSEIFEVQAAKPRKLDELMSQMDETFSQRLFRMIREKNLDETEIYKKAYIDRRHFSKIRNDINYSPTKKTVLAFALAMELSVDEAKDLLDSAGFSLSMSSKADVIVLYFLENEIYDMFEINDVLDHFGQPVFA